MRRLKLICTSLALSAMLTWSSEAAATILTFEANFDGLQEVPPNASPGFGFGQATLDDTSGLFTIQVGTYQDLLGGATLVLLQQAAPGVGGPVIFALILDTPGAATGTFSGGGALPGPQITAMIAGNTYLNIRSLVFPAGELRGQLLDVTVPEPSSLALAVAGALGLTAWGWRRKR